MVSSLVEWSRLIDWSGMQAADKAQRQHLDNLRVEATEERQRELEKGAHQALHALAPIYSLVILQHSTYKQVSRLPTRNADVPHAATDVCMLKDCLDQKKQHSFVEC